MLANDSYEAMAIAQDKIDYSNLNFEANEVSNGSKNKQFFVTCSVCKLKESDWVALLTNIEPEEHKIMCRECFIKSQANL